MFQPSMQCSQFRKRGRNTIISGVRSLVNLSNFDYRTHDLYLTKHIPPGTHRNQHGIVFANVKGLLQGCQIFFQRRLNLPKKGQKRPTNLLKSQSNNGQKIKIRHLTKPNFKTISLLNTSNLLWNARCVLIVPPHRAIKLKQFSE